MEGWGSAYIGTYTVTVWPNCETTGTDASALKMSVRTAGIVFSVITKTQSYTSTVHHSEHTFDMKAALVCAFCQFTDDFGTAVVKVSLIHLVD